MRGEGGGGGFVRIMLGWEGWREEGGGGGWVLEDSCRWRQAVEGAGGAGREARARQASGRARPGLPSQPSPLCRSPFHRLRV